MCVRRRESERGEVGKKGVGKGGDSGRIGVRAETGKEGRGIPLQTDAVSLFLNQQIRLIHIWWAWQTMLGYSPR